jgi:hypothetical protein
MIQQPDSNSETISEDDDSQNTEERPHSSSTSTEGIEEDYVPSTSEPYATNLPSANTPAPEAANPDINANASLPKQDH